MKKIDGFNFATIDELIKGCYLIDGDDGKAIFNGDFVSFTNYKDDRDGVKAIGVVNFSEDLLRFEIAVFSEKELSEKEASEYDVTDFLPFGQDLFGDLKSLK